MGKKKRKESSDSGSSDSDDSDENDRKKDLKERDDFAKRLKARDKERTKNVAQTKAAPSGNFSKLPLPPLLLTTLKIPRI